MPATTSFSLVLPDDLAEALDDIVLDRNSKRVRPRASRAAILREAAASFVQANSSTGATRFTNPNDKDA